MSNPFRSVAVLAFLLLADCAYTESAAVRNPELATIQYHKVVVFAPFDNLMARKNIEDGMVAALREQHINALPSYTLFLMEPDKQKRRAAYFASGADCVLRIIVQDAGVTQQQISGPTTTTTGSANCYGGNCYGQATTTTRPGQTVTRPHMTFTVRVIDLATDKVAWEMQAQGNGNGYANFETVEASFESKTAEDVLAANLFVK